jgi:hypothetical protein
LTRLASELQASLFAVASRLFQTLDIGGPLLIQVSLHNVASVRGLLPDRYTARADLELGRSLVSFVEEASASEVICAPETVVERIIDRLALGFGFLPKQ